MSRKDDARKRGVGTMKIVTQSDPFKRGVEISIYVDGEKKASRFVSAKERELCENPERFPFIVCDALARKSGVDPYAVAGAVARAIAEGTVQRVPSPRRPSPRLRPEVGQLGFWRKLWKLLS